MSELEESLLIFYTGKSRDSASIIKDQMKSLENKSGKSLEAMHLVKQGAIKIKEHLLKGEVGSVTEEFRSSWIAKKNTSKSISNASVEHIEKIAFDNGALSLKVSGAGGGGFMMIFVKPTSRMALEKALQKEGQVYKIQFTDEGCTSWTI